MIRIALTGFEGLDNPHPGIGVARALREGLDGQVEIVALGYDALMTGAWMPGAADELHVMPSLADGDDAAWDRLMAIHEHRALDILIPCLDLDVPVYARRADRLAQAGIGALLPRPESVYAVGKLRLPKLCHAHGIPTPRTIHVLDMDDVPLHADQFGYPLVVKGVVAGAKLVADRRAAVAEAKKLNARWGGGVLLQQAVTGEEFVVAAVLDTNGESAGLVAMRKLGISEQGKGVVGTVIDDPDIEKHARRILACLNWRGPLELEFIRPHGAKDLQLVEVNCRFPSWIMLAHWAGANLAALLVDEIRSPGQQRLQRPRPGTTFVRNVRECAVPLAQVRALARTGSSAGVPAAPRSIGRSGDGIRVAVTGVSTFDVVNAGLGVARALRGQPGIAAVYGMGYAPFDSGLYRSDLFDAAFRLPASDDAQALLERLTEIRDSSPFDVIVPCLDGEIPRFIEIHKALAGIGVHTLLPGWDAFDRRGKRTLFGGGQRDEWASFGIPETVCITAADQIDEAAHRIGFPIAVKGPVSHAIRADNRDDMRAAWDVLRDKGCDAALVQPFIDGDRFAVATLCGRTHEPLASLTVKKLKVCDRGSTWSAVRVPAPALEADFANFMRSIGWVGPAEGEFIRDKVTDRFYLIEVNPRFTAWISFSASLAQNQPRLAVDAALGRPVTDASGNGDLVFMRSCEDMPVTPSAFAAIAKKGTLRHG